MATSSSAASSSSVTNPPKGWIATFDAHEMDYYWNSSNAPGSVIAAQYNLKDPTPEMCTDPSSPTPRYIFSSADKLYLWNLMDGRLWGIKTKGSAQVIADQIGSRGIESLELETPQQAMSWADI
ncbi:hypothetical protein F4821DRAFT_234230 [Hypoxylon rubiginosum]|uniref:Uncharacterized protein n=1 Tax=Hypoxylon rubiginosum TaxID=110542 RepID=A0ACC0D6T3_9PEZI|nr:hypothetical protein F4821DRAFT_234230 [Hypoxylon rubiginosum]